jgi:hypothetical protein
VSIIIPSPPGSGTGTGTTALEVQRRLTSAFIAALPTVITLTPRSKVKQPAGGWTLLEGTPRAPQTMTLVEQTGLDGQPLPRTTLDGVERVVSFEIVAEWDAAIARWDVFTHQGKDWEVIDLYFDNGYEKRALVSARG